MKNILPILFGVALLPIAAHATSTSNVVGYATSTLTSGSYNLFGLTLHSPVEASLTADATQTTADNIVRDPVRCARGAVEEVTRLRINDDRIHALNANLRAIVHLFDERLKLEWGAELSWDTVDTSSRRDGNRDSNFELTASPRGNFSEGSSYLSAGAFLFADILLFTSTDEHAGLASTTR